MEALDLIAIIAVALLVGGLFVAELTVLVRKGRRRGYRGPFLGAALVTLTMTVVIGGALVVALDTDVDGHAPFAGVAAGLIGVALAANWLLVAVLPRRPERVAGRRRAAFPFAGLTVVLGVGVVVVPVVLIATGESVVSSLRLGMGLGSVAAVTAVMARRAKAPQAADVAELQSQPAAVLFLRGFLEDRRIFSVSDARRRRRGVRRWLGPVFVDSNADYLTAERYLGPAIAEAIGPMVGLGNPTDYLPPDGPVLRHYAPDDGWQREVTRLVARVRAVVVLASPSTASLSWELTHLRVMGALDRTFLVLPPQRHGRLRVWIEQYALGLPPLSWPRLVRELGLLGYAVPEADPGPGTVLGFDETGRAVVLASGVTSAEGYATAVATGLR